MCFSATMRRPLRSKRAMISPVRPRANASGLTRMRVRSMGVSPPGGFVSRARRRRRLVRRRGALLDLAGRLAAARRRGTGACPAPRPRSTGRSATAGSSGLPQFAHGSLSLRMQFGQRRKSFSTCCVAVRAERGSRSPQARLGRLHLELALAHVVEVLGRAHDHVDDRADEREEQRRERRAADEHRVVDPPAGVGVRPVHEREPDHDRKRIEQVDGQVQAVAVDAEDGEHDRAESAVGAAARRTLRGTAGRTRIRARRTRGSRARR